MKMKGYYQDRDGDQRQLWKDVTEDMIEQIRHSDAYHMSIYLLNLAVGVHPKDEEVQNEDIAYKGDLWFDIDHKPTNPVPTVADYHQAIKESITDAQRLVSYFETIGLTGESCRLFISGSKGFHISIPGSVMNNTLPTKNLPLIHKHMAAFIQAKAGTTGIDMALYCMGRGKLLRVENKKRTNGKFKVPVTWAELQIMTPESYDKLCEVPRIESLVLPTNVCNELAIMFGEAADAVEVTSKIIFESTPSEQLAIFSDGNHPTCVNWFVENKNIKEASGNFNKAKMSFARYLSNADITNAELNLLIDEFAENWTSHSRPTVDGRREALRDTLSYGKAQGFSCKLMTNMLKDNPCTGCKLLAVQRQEILKKSDIEVTETGYYRPGKDKGTAISNFTLVTTGRVIDSGDGLGKFQILKCEIWQQSEGATQATFLRNHDFDNSAFESSRSFKNSLKDVAGLLWVGNDTDLQHIKVLLTNKAALAGGTIVERQVALGIAHHIDEERGIDEFVWLEEDYSLNTLGTKDSLQFNGLRAGVNQPRNLKLEGVTKYDSSDETQNETLRNLLKVNIPEIVAPTLGWVMGCWLRTHIRAMGSTDKHLPALQIYGSSGHGKTETATLFSALAGADFASTEPLVVSSSTPYAIKVEASISLTIPRIFDEMNEHRIVDRARYTQAYEAVKMTARGGFIMSGDVVDNKLGLKAMSATSPIIMLATQLNTSAEIHERTIPLSINKAHRKPSHTVAFKAVRDNYPHLIALARTAMETTIKLPVAWVEGIIAVNKALIPGELSDRIAENWRFALVGLDYLVFVLEGSKAPQDILDAVVELKAGLVQYLADNRENISAQGNTQEIDNVIDTFGEMTIQEVGYHAKIKQGDHYIVAGDTLHIWSAAIFPMYVKYCRNVMMRPPEMSSIKQFQDLVGHQDYYLGSCPPDGVRGRAGWHSLHIPGLVARGVRVENFLTD